MARGHFPRTFSSKCSSRCPTQDGIKVQLTLVHELGVEPEASELGGLGQLVWVGCPLHVTSVLRPGVGLLAPLNGKPRLRFSGEASLGLVVTRWGLWNTPRPSFCFGRNKARQQSL